MKHEKLIEKHLGVNTPYWIKEKVDNAINEALRQFGVSGRSEQLICPHCGKYKMMQGNGIIHQLCECG